MTLFRRLSSRSKHLWDAIQIHISVHAPSHQAVYSASLMPAEWILSLLYLNVDHDSLIDYSLVFADYN